MNHERRLAAGPRPPRPPALRHLPNVAWVTRLLRRVGCPSLMNTCPEEDQSGGPNLTKARLLRFLERLGARARTPGACFITGGGTALLVGWRETTIDLDLKFDPEPEGVFDAIPALKRELQIHVELAAPSDFLPPLNEWRERSRFVGRYGAMEVYR